VVANKSGVRLGVGNDPVYASNRCFDPFTFPASGELLKAQIRSVAEELDAFRKQRQREHLELTLTQMYNVLEKLRGHLFIQAQAGLTLFRDVFADVFKAELRIYLPERVLPLSTSPPLDLSALFDTEVNEIRKLLKPRSRRRTEAEARLRSLTIVETSLKQAGVNIATQIATQLFGIRWQSQGKPGTSERKT
jgi:hypothetical protein